jgi:hypothetical protein
MATTTFFSEAPPMQTALLRYQEESVASAQMEWYSFNDRHLNRAPFGAV